MKNIRYKKFLNIPTVVFLVIVFNFLSFLSPAKASLMEMVQPQKYIEGINNIPSTTPVSGNSSADTVAAPAPIPFTPNVSVGSSFQAGASSEINPDSLGKYIQAWYTLIISVVGIIATVMLMWGGMKWLTSRGNSKVISEAKEIIWSAIIGLALTLLSWTILSLINEKLVVMQSLDIKRIDYKGSQDQNIGSETQFSDTTSGAGGGASVPLDGTAQAANTAALGPIGVGQNVRVDGLTPGIIDIAKNLQTASGANMAITSAYRPGDAGSNHANGTALDFSTQNDKFNNYMVELIKNSGTPLLDGSGNPITYNGQPIYNVTFPGGATGRVIDERSVNHCWHVDQGK
ncbi:MAG: pilin [Patescibacteria group bacterium]